jgi:hypothetical protein
MKYLTKDHLLKIRSLETEDFKFSHSLAALTDDYVAKLSPDVRLPVTFEIFDRAAEGPYKTTVRVIIIIPIDGKSAESTTQATVDMPLAEYDALPEMH